MILLSAKSEHRKRKKASLSMNVKYKSETSNHDNSNMTCTQQSRRQKSTKLHGSMNWRGAELSSFFQQE